MKAADFRVSDPDVLMRKTILALREALAVPKGKIYTMAAMGKAG